LAYGLRLWASVCVSLLLAFWLQMENPFWAATSAALVCQPSLGASIRKANFRLVGTVIGAAVMVAIMAAFPQDRIGFIVSLAAWCGLCGVAATLLQNFASYGAALAGPDAARHVPAPRPRSPRSRAKPAWAYARHCRRPAGRRAKAGRNAAR
jgi:uncharacterized membrane protein YccC